MVWVAERLLGIGRKWLNSETFKVITALRQLKKYKIRGVFSLVITYYYLQRSLYHSRAKSELPNRVHQTALFVSWSVLNSLDLLISFYLRSSKMMPFYKLCDTSRTKRKAVVANSLEELITIGRLKHDPCFKMMLLNKLVYGNPRCPGVIAKYPNKFPSRFKKHVIYDLAFIFISGGRERNKHRILSIFVCLTRGRQLPEMDFF